MWQLRIFIYKAIKIKLKTATEKISYTSTYQKIGILHKVLILFGIHIFYKKVAFVPINTVSAVNVERSDRICKYCSVHKIRIFSLSGVKCLAVNVGEKYASHLDTRNVAANVLPPSGTTGGWRNWCARTDFRSAGKLPSSEMRWCACIMINNLSQNKRNGQCQPHNHR